MDKSTRRKASEMAENVAGLTPAPMDEPEDAAAAAAVEFARICGKLKRTLRTGWVRRGVYQPESVADHSWRVAVLCLLMGREENVNVPKCMQLAIVHDLAESIVGDICPEDGISKEAKRKKEEDAMHSIAAILKRATSGNSNGAQQLGETESPSEVLTRLFEEYEQRQTAESLVVKDLDLLDMIIQADEYEACGAGDGHESDKIGAQHLEDFFVNTPPGKFQTSVGKRVAQQVHKERNKRIKQQQQTEAAANRETSPTTATEQDAEFVDSFMASHSNWKREDAMEIVAALRKHDKEQSDGSKLTAR